jgi:RAB protein geranylgeranyltransferase component A
MPAKKEPIKHFFAFPKNWDDLTEKEQEEWVNQLYDRMMEKFKEHDK